MAKAKTVYYKALEEDGTTPQGFGRYNPDSRDWQHAIEGKLVACEKGYHVLRLKDILNWDCPVLYKVEVKGRPVHADTKSVVRTFRFVERVGNWNERNQRLFACDCADRALALIDKDKVDPRSIEAVRIARLFAIDRATKEDLAAAWDAARAAAWAAARDAARDTAWDAAWAAAWAAAWDAAWAAARAAAWAAARAAAWAAARAAARNTEIKWQIERLRQYLDGEVS